MKQQREIEKLCSILNELTNEMNEIDSFYNVALANTMLELEDNYNDPIYDTQIIIQDDFTATVERHKKFGLLQFKRYKEAPESQTINLSQYEVLECLSKLILPALEDYLNKMKKGIGKLQEIGITNSTVIEALGLLRLLHNEGESIQAKHIENIKQGQGHPELEDMFIFVRDFKDYLSVFDDYDVFRRFYEFPIRLGFDVTTELKKPGRPPKNFRINTKIQNYINENPACLKSTSPWQDIAKGIDFKSAAKDKGRALRDYCRKNGIRLK